MATCIIRPGDAGAKPISCEPLYDAAERKDRLIAEYQDSPVLKDFIGLYRQELDGTLDCLNDMSIFFCIDQAAGEWLDIIGAIVGQGRFLYYSEGDIYFGYQGHPLADGFASSGSPDPGRWLDEAVPLNPGDLYFGFLGHVQAGGFDLDTTIPLGEWFHEDDLLSNYKNYFGFEPHPLAGGFGIIGMPVVIEKSTGGIWLNENLAPIDLPTNDIGDEDYRIIIKAKIARNHHNGTLNDTIKLFQLLFQVPCFVKDLKNDYAVTITRKPSARMASILQYTDLVPNVLGFNRKIYYTDGPIFGFQGIPCISGFDVGSYTGAL